MEEEFFRGDSMQSSLASLVSLNSIAASNEEEKKSGTIDLDAEVGLAASTNSATSAEKPP